MENNALVPQQLATPASFLRLCIDKGHGCTQEDLLGIGFADHAAIMRAANVLLSEGRIALTQLGPGKFLYTASDPGHAAKIRGLDNQHMLVYQLIQKSGDKGAWSRSIKDESHLQPHAITKITKELIRRQLVKEVKSVQSKNRKVFMAWDVEPAREISGGTWYHDGVLATTWISQLRDRCWDYFDTNARKIVTLHEVFQYVVQQPGRSVPTEDEVAQILNTLVLDEKLNSVQSREGEMVYTVRSRVGEEPFNVLAGRLPVALTRLDTQADGCVCPCMQCPLAAECQPGGRISPERCEYINNWLSGAEGEEDQDMNDW